jgi:type I restriction enzyme S subunit
MTRWPKRRLGDLTDVLSGFAFDSEGFGDSGEIPVVRIRDVVPGRSSTFYRGAFDSRFIVDSGDILIGMDGEFNRARWCGGKALLNQRVSRIAPSSRDIDDGYLFYFLPAALKAIEQVTPFVTVKHLSVKQIRDIVVPLPPLPEQRRIAETLDKADALRAKRRAALAQLDTLTQSIFLDMFGDPATNPKGWPVDALRNIAETTSGGTPRREVDGYFGGAIPWVKSGELHQAVVSATEESLTERGLAESSAKLMPLGTVLVAMYGATVGAVAILGVEAATNQAVCCINPSHTLTSEYLAHLLRKMAPSLLAKRVGGAQPNLSQELLRNLRIPVPPREVQRDFGQRLAVVAGLGRELETATARTDALFASLQHRAFRGEL